MSRRVEHGQMTRVWKWGFPIGWRATGVPGPGHAPTEAADQAPTPTEAPATPTGPDLDMSRVELAVERLNRRERDPLRVTTDEPPRPAPAMGKPWDSTEAPERQWPAPLPDEHLVFVPHCDGRHGPKEGDAGGCVWCDVLADLASDLRETRRRVSELEAADAERRSWS